MTNVTKSYIAWKFVATSAMLASISTTENSAKSIWLDALLGYCAIQSLVLLAYFAYNDNSRHTQNRLLYLCHPIMSAISAWILTWTFDSALSVLNLFEIQVFARDGQACGIGLTYLAVISFEMSCIQMHNVLNLYVKHD